MKPMNPLESLREVGGGNGSVEEQAQFHNAAYGQRESRATDATLNWSGGQHEIHPGGPNDDMPYPENVAMVSGGHSTVDPHPIDFGHRATPVPEDGFGDAGSGVAKITGR